MPDIMGDYNWSNEEYEPIRDEHGKPTGYHRVLKTGEVVTLDGPCNLHPPKGTVMSPWSVYEFDRYAVVGQGGERLMAEGAKVRASSADEAMRKALALFGPGTTLVPRKQSSAAD